MRRRLRAATHGQIFFSSMVSRCSATNTCNSHSFLVSTFALQNRRRDFRFRQGFAHTAGVTADQVQLQFGKVDILPKPVLMPYLGGRAFREIVVHNRTRRLHVSCLRMQHTPAFFRMPMRKPSRVSGCPFNSSDEELNSFASLFFECVVSVAHGDAQSLGCAFWRDVALRHSQHFKPDHKFSYGRRSQQRRIEMRMKVPIRVRFRIRRICPPMV